MSGRLRGLVGLNHSERRLAHRRASTWSVVRLPRGDQLALLRGAPRRTIQLSCQGADLTCHRRQVV